MFVHKRKKNTAFSSLETIVVSKQKQNKKRQHEKILFYIYFIGKYLNVSDLISNGTDRGASFTKFSENWIFTRQTL